MTKNQVELGFKYLLEQKKNGRVMNWEEKVNKDTARRYAYNLKKAAEKAGINLEDYLTAENPNLDELADKLKDIEITAQPESEQAQEQKEEVKETPKEEPEPRVEKMVSAMGSGRDIIKRNVSRSREVAKLYVREKESKSAPPPSISQPQQQPQSEKKTPFAFLKSSPILLWGLAIGALVLVIVLMLRRPSVQSTPTPQANVNEKSLENEISYSPEDELYRELAKYTVWKPGGAA